MNSPENVANIFGTIHAIIEFCKKNKDMLKTKPETTEDIIEILNRMTLINHQTLRIIVFRLTSRPSMLRYLSETGQNPCIIQYNCFRNIIYNFYLKKHVVPTKRTIMKHIGTSQTYDTKTLDNDLKANGFIMKKLAKTRTSLITEDPKQVYNRMIYLNKVKTFRQLNKNFVYILYRDRKFFFAVSPKSGLLSFQSFTKSNSKESQAFKFIQSLMPHIAENSVVVIDSQDLLDYSRCPNQFSSKQQMKEWLDKHDIIYEAEAHTAELYYLIQKYRKKYPDTCGILDFLQSHRLLVLRVPPESECLSYFHQISKLTKLDNMTEAQYRKKIFSKYGTKEIIQLEEKLKAQEIEIYVEDLEVEKIVDMISLVSIRTKIMPRELVSCDMLPGEDIPPYLILD